MAPTPPLDQDYRHPPRGRSAMLASTAMPQVGFGLSERTGGDRHPGADGAPSIALSSAAVRIEDGLLMAFGPDGDPIPPGTFVPLAAEQADAEVKLADGRTVPALQVAQVLEAQATGRLGAGAGDPAGAAAWIEAMLGLGPKPAHAAEAELSDEPRGCELTVFGHELMLATPDGRAFVIADAAPAEPAVATVGLVLADGAGLAVGDLAERLRRHAGQRPPADVGNAAVGAGESEGGAPVLPAGSQPTRRVQPFADVVLPGCAVERRGEELVLELPGVGALRLARLAQDAPSGPRVDIAHANGEAAGLADVLAAFEPAGGPGRRAAGAERLALPAPERREALPSPAAPLRRVPVTFKAPHVEGVDPDQTVVVIIDGVPPGSVLSAGIDDGDGRWLVSPRHLAGLTLAPPAGWTGDPTLEVTAVAVRNRAGDFATAAASLVVALDSPAEVSLPLALDPALLQAEGPAFNAVMVRGIPAGARLSAGTYDATTDGWVLRPDQVAGLTLSAPVSQAAATLTVLGISLASGGRAEARVLTRLALPRH